MISRCSPSTYEHFVKFAYDYFKTGTIYDVVVGVVEVTILEMKNVCPKY